MNTAGQKWTDCNHEKSSSPNLAPSQIRPIMTSRMPIFFFRAGFRWWVQGPQHILPMFFDASWLIDMTFLLFLLAGHAWKMATGFNYFYCRFIWTSKYIIRRIIPLSRDYFIYFYDYDKDMYILIINDYQWGIPPSSWWFLPQAVKEWSGPAVRSGQGRRCGAPWCDGKSWIGRY